MGSGIGPPLKPPGRPRTARSKLSNKGISYPLLRFLVRTLKCDLLKRRRCRIGLFAHYLCHWFRNRMGIGNESDQANRAISTGKLNALPRLHSRPINVVVYHGSQGRTRFEVGFSLRCLQRLSRPYIATLHCGWRHNRSTRGTFIPVLSY